MGTFRDPPRWVIRNPMYYDAAPRWNAAERAANPDHPRWDDLDEQGQDRVYRRVRDVLLGEVRRSEASPGDLVIWNGRFRGNEMIVAAADMLPAPPVRPPGKGPRLHGQRDVRVWHLYDTLDISLPLLASCHPPRFFSNLNVGNYARTNINSAGCVGHDMTFVTAYLYITAFWTDQPEVVHDVMRTCDLRFEVGTRDVVAPTRLLDYFCETRPLRVVIPVRQNFGAWIHVPEGALERLARRLRSTFEIVLHVEGVMAREAC